MNDNDTIDDANDAGPLAEVAARLDAFDAAERRAALAELAAVTDLPATGTNVNMHFHSFFSFNAEEWSPTRIAWEARRAGLYAAGLCDFDVLDGLEEFLDAGLALGLRATVNIETRAYVAEYASVDINSPGEPGVAYVMGAGFVRPPAAGSPQAAGLAALEERARARNLALVERVNAALPLVAIDYARDVMPLTPGGCPTERHIVRAYANQARDVFGHPQHTAEFWSRILGRELLEVIELLADEPALEEAIRAKLVKRGGVGYEAPSPGSFPPVEDFLQWVAACGAVPMTAWLDGTSGGERDARALLECMRAKGAVALNIIPDRNWNIAKPDQRALKIDHLNRIVAAAGELELPINVGTEMNKLGLPFVDDLDGEALAPHKAAFLRGAQIMVGHTWLARYADFGYTSAAAEAEFGSVRTKNDFFAAVGALPPLTAEAARRLADLGPAGALAWFRGATGKSAA